MNRGDSNHFLLITSDSEDWSGGFIPSEVRIETRLREKKWPLYINTRNKKLIKTGDLCLFYAGGNRSPQSGRILFKATVDSIKSWRSEVGSLDALNAASQNPASYVSLSNVYEYQNKLVLKDLLGQLSFCPKNMTKWGAVLQGGMRKIEKRDFDLIEQLSNAK